MLQKSKRKSKNFYTSLRKFLHSMSREWASGLDDKQLVVKIDAYREEGLTYREISGKMNVNLTTLYRWYNRRKRKFSDIHKTLYDFATRLQSLEENLVKGFTPPPPPPSAPLRADGNGPSKPRGDQIHNGNLLKELKEVNALYARIKEESANW